MTCAENVEKFLAQDQLQKLEGQLYPVCEKHCPQSLNCSRGISVECPVQVYIEHLKRHTKSNILFKKAKITPTTDIEQDHSALLKNELARPEHSRIKAKLRKITMIAQKLTDKGFDAIPEQNLIEVHYLMDELHEFDSMIRNLDSMIVRGYLYTCLDRITEKCRSFEEDMRWAVSEKKNDRMNAMR